MTREPGLPVFPREVNHGSILPVEPAKEPAARLTEGSIGVGFRLRREEPVAKRRGHPGLGPCGMPLPRNPGAGDEILEHKI